VDQPLADFALLLRRATLFTDIDLRQDFEGASWDRQNTDDTSGPQVMAAILQDATAACESLGFDMNVFDVKLTVVENTPKVHNVIVCTLCSCYPRSLLGQPPAWYRNKAYRSRVVREPRKVLAEFGSVVPDDVEVHVHDSNADLRFIVLPMRPAGTEHLGEAELAAMVTRDSLIGVAPPRAA
jgi:nitrile hydratase